MSDAAPAHPRFLYLVGGPGNAERVDVVDLFAKRVAAAGFDVDYVIFSREPGPAWREVAWHGARAWVVGRSARPGLAGAVLNKGYELLADLRTTAKALSGRYDIVQVRDKFVVGVLAGAAAKLRGRVFTYWLSYPFAECRIVDGREGNSRYPRLSILGGTVAKWLLYRIILPLADHVFVQSEQMKADVAAEGIDTGKMTPVPMAVDESLLDVPRQTPEAGTLLYLGTLIRVRRLDTLLEALLLVHDRHPGARLVFVGEGDSPEDRAFLERRAAELDLTTRVEFTGMLPMSLAHERVLRSAVCVSPFYPIPILLSTSPTKISEYMALGRPVVANTHPEQSRIIAESGAGFCVEWSPEAFATAIIRLLDDPAAAERMGALGRDYVRRHRIYPVVAPRVVAEYRRLLGSPAGRAEIDRREHG